MELLTALVDLVLPASCAGCGAPGVRAACCRPCAVALAAARPQRVRPKPEPPGLPRTVALAAYDGALRSALLAYKDRGRHDLAALLGDRLADVVAAGLGAPAAGLGAPAAGLGAVPRPVLLVPVPDTAAAARERHGDHMLRLARRAAGTLRRRGRPAAVASPLRARPRPDSVELSAADRVTAAATAFALRHRRLPDVRAAVAAGVTVVLVDDVITTGATLSAAADLLGRASVPVPLVAVLAATRRRADREPPSDDDSGRD